MQRWRPGTHVASLKSSQALLVIPLTRPKEGRILSGLASLEPNHLAQGQPHGQLQAPVLSPEPLIPLQTHTGRPNSCHHSHSFLVCSKCSQNVTPQIQAKLTANFRGPTEPSSPGQAPRNEAVKTHSPSTFWLAPFSCTRRWYQK